MLFVKIKDIFQGFGSLVSLRLQKDGAAKSKQIWTNLSHWNTDGLSSHWEELLLLFFNLYAEVQLLKRDIATAVIYYYTTTEFRPVSLRETGSCVRYYTKNGRLIPTAKRGKEIKQP